MLSLLSPSLCTNGRPLLSRSRRLSFPSSRSRLVDSSLCRRRTPASAPTLASQTVSTALRRAAGRRRWTSLATRCTSATILTRRYRLLGAVLLYCGELWECMLDWSLGCVVLKFPLQCDSFTLRRQSYSSTAWTRSPRLEKYPPFLHFACTTFKENPSLLKVCYWDFRSLKSLSHVNLQENNTLKNTFILLFWTSA